MVPLPLHSDPLSVSADVDTPGGIERGLYLRRLQVAGCGVSVVTAAVQFGQGEPKQNYRTRQIRCRRLSDLLRAAVREIFYYFHTER